MKLRSLASVIAGIAFLALTSFAQVTTIEGNVKGPDGKPLEKAQVKIIRTDIKANYDTKTDKKGHYLYMGLPIGNYNVELYVDGKKVDVVNGIRTRLGDPVPVHFDLATSAAATQAKQAEMQKAMETGQISKEMERGMTKEQKEAMEKQLKQREAEMKKRGELNTAFGAGMEAMTAQKWDDAITNFNKAAETDPAQVAVWSQLGEAYSKSATGKTGAEFDAALGKALESYAKAIALKPEDPGMHNNYALALGRAKKYPEMQAEFQKAAELEPTPEGKGKYYYNLGAMLTNVGQTDAAIESFKKAIELGNADAYFQFGVALSAKMTIAPDGKITAPPGTIEAFQKYLELQPNGQFAEGAKGMLQQLGSTVQTKFSDPSKKADPKKKK